MLVTIGRTQKKHDLVDALLECHERIRRFSTLAHDLGRRSDVPILEVVETCDRCTRYFTDALPLHVTDEEESLVPRLEGLSPEIDAALATMAAQHHEHHALLARTLDALAQVRAEPDATTPRQALSEAASQLVPELEKHLAMEETVLFPALRKHVPVATQDLIAGEIRARRDARP